jgi:hypothetical protein
MDIEAALKLLAPYARRDGFDCEAVSQLDQSSSDATDLFAVLRTAIGKGHLTTNFWRGVTGAAEPADFPRAFGALFDHLADAQLVMEAEGMPSQWQDDALRLWAYTGNWLLLSQDEDLMLMDEKLTPELLVVASEMACPKRDYMLDCIAHWARDEAFAAVGTARFAETVTRIAAHQAEADAAGAPALGAYLARLGSYARPAQVREADAVQRALDLTRCAEPKPDRIRVTLEGEDWVVLLPGYTKKLLKIAQSNGSMRV